MTPTDNALPEDSTPSASAPDFGMGATAHFMHWAHVFMWRYWQARGREIGATSPTQIIIDKLNKMSGEIRDIAKLPKEEWQEQFGRYCQRNETVITQCLMSALVCARAVAKDDANLEPGSGKSDSKDPEEKELSKANFEKLGNGLAASLAAVGRAYGGLNIPNSRPNLSTTGNVSTIAGLYGRFKQSISRIVYQTSSTGQPARSDAELEARRAYNGGFHGGRNNANPRIAQHDEHGGPKV